MDIVNHDETSQIVNNNNTNGHIRNHPHRNHSRTASHNSHLSRGTSRSRVSDTTQIKIHIQREQAQNQELKPRDIVFCVFILIFLLVGLILFFIYQDNAELGDKLSVVLKWFANVKWQSLPILVLLYIVAMIFIIPIKSILGLVFGLFYGLGFGIFLTYISAVIGILLAFLLGRYVCKSLTQRFIYYFCIRRFGKKQNKDDNKWEDQQKKERKFKRYVELFDHLCSKEGFKCVLMIRFSIFPPSEWTNYIFANTSVSFMNFAIGSAVGRLFASASIYVYIGSTLSDILDIINNNYPSGFWYSFIIAASLYIGFFILLIVLTKKAKEWLKGREEQYIAHKKLKTMNSSSFYDSDVDHKSDNNDTSPLELEKIRSLDSDIDNYVD